MAKAFGELMSDLGQFIRECASWQPIDDSTPRDEVIEVFAPGVEGLNDLVTLCRWHEDAGFTVCEFRTPSHWRWHIRPQTNTREL